MRLFGLVILGLLLGRPAQAQTVKFSDLVGQWARQGEKTPAMSLRADSTLTAYKAFSMNMSDGSTHQLDATGRWRLAGDTLMLRDLQPRGMEGAEKQAPMSRLVKLNGRRLTLTELTKDAKSRVYERLDAPTP
jgi:hypothetical protein